jgi:hypothetical protein
MHSVLNYIIFHCSFAMRRYVPEIQGINLPTTQAYLYWPALVPEAGASLSLSNVAGFTVGRSNCTEPVLMQYVLNNGQVKLALYSTCT